MADVKHDGPAIRVAHLIFRSPEPSDTTSAILSIGPFRGVALWSQPPPRRRLAHSLGGRVHWGLWHSLVIAVARFESRWEAPATRDDELIMRPPPQRQAAVAQHVDRACGLDETLVETLVLAPGKLIATIRALTPGVLMCAIIAMTATFVSEHHGGPTLLYALLIGIALHSLWKDTAARAGVDFTARTVLRIGVALLGARISAGQIADLGLPPVLLVLGGVISTIALGWLLARILGLSAGQGVLTGGAVSICGASAALAIAAVLPPRADRERDLLFTVMGVTILSTAAMILYPPLARVLGLDDTAAGMLFGATIHDVAQVVGAGHLVSDRAAVVATYVKLLRVALLVPVVIGVGWMARRRYRGTGSAHGPMLPGFLVAFAALAALNSAGAIPPLLSEQLGAASRWLLVSAIAAVGVKTSIEKLKDVGLRPLVLLLFETFFLLALVLSVLAIATPGPG